MINEVIVFFEFLALVIVMFSMALIADKFLIPTLTNIAKKYSLSEQIEGILLAIGSSIPEFTTNLIASLSNNADIGVGAIAGSGSYDFTICFGIASLFTCGMTLHPMLFYRDSVVYLLTLALLIYFLLDQQIKLIEAILLTCLWPVYIFISTFKIKDEQADNQLQSNNIHESETNLEEGHNNFKKQPSYPSFDNNEIVVLDVMPIKENQNDNNDALFKTSAAPNYIDINNELNGDHVPHNKDDEQTDLLHSEIVKNENNDKIIEEPESNPQWKGIGCIWYYFGKFYDKIGDLYGYFVPMWVDSPILGFLIIMLLIFLHSNLIVFVIQNISDRLHISETFLGMTIISWGGNIGDTINACVAAKMNASALISTSILASQITNLQLCLGFPWLIAIIKRKIQGYENSSIVFGSLDSNSQNNPLFYFIPLIICVFLSMIIFGSFRMILNKWSGGLLSLVYIAYIVYETYIQAN